MSEPTKDEFLAEYRRLLVEGLKDKPYSWTKDQVRLDRFMASVANTIRTRETTWNYDSDCARRAFRICHGHAGVKYSLRALRALPDPQPAVTAG